MRTSATPTERITGELLFEVQRRDARSVVVSQHHSGALRVLRAHYVPGSTTPTLIIVNPGGGYLGGDRYRVTAHVKADAALVLTTQASTKIYRTPDGPATSQQHFALDRGARLECVPDSVIAYRDARFHQYTEVAMHPHASLVMSEIVTPGWSPDGSLFSYDEVSMRTRVVLDSKVVVLDNLLLRPAHDVTGALMLDGRTHIGSLLVVDPRGDSSAIAALRELFAVNAPQIDAEAIVGISRLNHPGVLLRVLTHSTPAATALLHLAINWLRAEWFDEPALDLRKP